MNTTNQNIVYDYEIILNRYIVLHYCSHMTLGDCIVYKRMPHLAVYDLRKDRFKFYE